MFVCVIKIYSRHYFKHSLVCYLFELNVHKFSSIFTHKDSLTSFNVKVATCLSLQMSQVSKSQISEKSKQTLRGQKGEEV